MRPTDTPQPTATLRPISCADLDTAWGAADWPGALSILDRLQAANVSCGEQSLDGKRYAVRINYAVALENSGDVAGAISQYQAALTLNPSGAEALNALARLKALPTPTAPACNPGQLAPYSPSSGDFVTIANNQLIAGNAPLVVQGINYYPRHAPWAKFLTDFNTDEVKQELDLIAATGFNALRIFIWYEPLFTCAPESATPNPELFAKLDAFIQSASEHHLRLIVTLNDLPDLLFRPLYTDYAHYDAQTTFILNRYKDEPAILAWDLRNEGDIDYGAHPDIPKKFERDVVLTWLSHISNVVRSNDSHHLLTAGWWGDASETADAVDLISFHHWSSATELAGRVALLRVKTAKPILLEEIGYPSTNGYDESTQAQALQQALTTAGQDNLAGWLVCTAFDFAPPAGQPATVEHSFGLWRLDLSPKPALQSLPISIKPYRR